MNAVWARYRRTFLLTQVMVLVVCIVAHHQHENLQTVIAAVLFMQIASFIGAWSAERMRKRTDAQRQLMPLKRPRL
jgi:uncharacterized membrane protein YqjE